MEASIGRVTFRFYSICSSEGTPADPIYWIGRQTAYLHGGAREAGQQDDLLRWRGGGYVPRTCKPSPSST